MFFFDMSQIIGMVCCSELVPFSDFKMKHSEMKHSYKYRTVVAVRQTDETSEFFTKIIRRNSSDLNNSVVAK